MSGLLQQIDDPADTRELTIAELNELCFEIREEILRVMAANGGHLASSLGTVELTVALHYLFDTPRDRLVWDTGHQAYAHKILTGRRDRFSTIRQEGGLSGFLLRSESPYDAFGAGHASTSISAALGMAIARDRQGENHRVVAIVGDGAMTGGLCYEALNNAGNVKSDLLVILNDNKMSISKTTGALASTFNKIVTRPFYNEHHRKIVEIIKRLPAGETMRRFGHRLEESVKAMILPGVFFEELGFRYLGPIDGHDLDLLIPMLKRVRELRGPILLHVITIKGKGRTYSEADPIRWYSPPAPNFDLETGAIPPKKPSPPSYSVVFAETLIELARKDPRIVAVTAAMLEGTALVRFEKVFPERTLDVGIAEEHAVIAAAGMACDGLRPFVCIYSTFLQRSIDSLIHDVALQNLPVVFALDRAGLVGADGPTHHGVFDLTYLRMIPGMVVMAPKDAMELRRMIRAAHEYDEGPVAIRFPRGTALGKSGLGKRVKPLAIGRGEILAEGGEVCLIAIGNMVSQAKDAAQLLAAEKIRVGVVNARFVKPLDRDLLAKLCKTYRHLITIEDNVKAGGFGSGVNEALEEMGIAQRAHILAIPDRFVPQGKMDSLYDQCGISAPAISQTVKSLLKTGGPRSGRVAAKTRSRKKSATKQAASRAKKKSPAKARKKKSKAPATKGRTKTRRK